MNEDQEQTAPDEEKETNISTDPVPEISCEQCGARIDLEGVQPFSRVDCGACGHTHTVPARLGSFLLLDLIGAGGMGGVYYAKDETLGRYVAIKVMLKSLGADTESLQTFQR